MASLVLGLVGAAGGWCLCGLPCLLAVIFGHIGRTKIRSGELAGSGAATTGLVLGYTFLAVALVAGFVFAWNPSDAASGVASLLTGVGNILTGLRDFFAELFS